MDKPFLTFEQQIHKLKTDYKLEIENEPFAIEVLASVSYYDLINGYKFVFMPDDKTFLEGTKLEHLFAFHVFNKNIQSILFKYSTYAENSFKTLFSHVVAEKISEQHPVYLDVNNYNKSRTPSDRVQLVKLLERVREIAETTRETPTYHYRMKKDHIPPWILFRNTNFSDTNDLFKALRSIEKKHFFSKVPLINDKSLAYEEKVSLMISSLRIVRKFRNKIAHNLSFLTYRGSALDTSANRIFNGTLVENSEVSSPFNNVWGYVLSIILILNNQYLSTLFLEEFKIYMTYEIGSTELYCKHAGIPVNYDERIKKYLDSLK